jgi:hypothetical protein
MATGRVDTMNPDQIKAAVKNRYGKFAAQGGSKEAC